MEKHALAALFAAGLDHDYAPFVADDSPIRIWRLGGGSLLPAASLKVSQPHYAPKYQLEVPLTIGRAWSSEISEQQAKRIKAALDRAGVGYLTELG